MSSSWRWDNHRQQHYRWDPNEQLYVYQSGMRLDQDGNEITPRPNTQDSNNLQNQPTSEQAQTSPSVSSSTTSRYSYGSDQSERYVNSGFAGQLSSPAHGAYYHTSQASSFPNHYAQGTYGSDQSNTPSLARTPIAASRLQRYGRGVRTHVYAHIGGTPGEAEERDHRYQIRRPGEAFFTIGTVFKVLWMEPAGNPNPSVSEFLCQTEIGPERLVTKIRWFVVVIPGQDHQCQCLPINTYGNQGVAKHGVVKANHAVLHNHDSTPRLTEAERPMVNERGMLSPIRVRGRLPHDRCHPMARINFARTYTVEHNVKVYHFGNVVKDDVSVLFEQWQRVLQAEAARALQYQITPVREEAGVGGS